MARFYFHSDDGQRVLDTDGLDLPSLSAARYEAIRYASCLLEDEARRVGRANDWRITVTDVAGLVMYELDFSVKASQAAAYAEREPA